MDLARVPFFERLAPARNVLIAGAGGGFDVFAGLPIYVKATRTMFEVGALIEEAQRECGELREWQAIPL
jgi:hypothetical protein